MPLDPDYAQGLVDQYGSIKAAARAMSHKGGHSFGAIRDALQRRNRPVIVEKPAEEILSEKEEEFKQRGVELAAVKGANKNLYGRLVEAKARVEDFIAAAHEAAYDAAISLGPVGPTVRPALYRSGDASTHTPEVALWHLTDWQGGKETTSYNSVIMNQRVAAFWKKAEEITAIQRADHPVNDCVIAFGGDMLEGLFNFPRQVFEVDSTLFTQFVQVAKLITETVQFALGMYDTVKVVAEWGNHGRIGSKRDNVPSGDNFDRIIYEHARQLLQAETRLIWDDCPEDVQRLEIGNYRALVIHGDEVGRGGFASPMQIVNHVNRWKSGAFPWDFRDVYVGHYHNHAEWPMANGQGAVYQTGSTESGNRYARDTMAASATPSQRLHFIDQEKGRVASQYKIFVSDGEPEFVHFR